MKRSFRYYTPILLFSLAFASCKEELRDIGFGEIYMPQATTSGGINNQYLVPSGGGIYTYNLVKEDGKVRIMLGVSRSGDFNGDGFSVKIKVNEEETQKALNSGEINNGIELPKDSYDLPSEIMVPDGENEAIFYLDVVDTVMLLNDLAYTGNKFILSVSLESPTNYLLSETNTTTTIVIDVDRVRSMFFKPREGFIYREGTSLMLNGKEFKGVGLNVPSLFGCVDSEEQEFSLEEVATLFKELPDNILVRTFGFASDKDRVDKVIKLAEENNIKLILSLLEGSNNGCGAYWVSKEWYSSGYKESGFLDYLEEMAQKYKNSPAIGVWEIVDRPGQYMGLDQDILKPFLNECAKILKASDMNHLVSSGLESEYAYGTNMKSDEFENMHNSVYLDAGTYNDIDRTQVESWHYPATITALKNLDKVYYIMNEQMKAADDGSCGLDIDGRFEMFKNKVDHYISSGTAVVFSPPFAKVAPEDICDQTFDREDPLFEWIKNNSLNQDNASNMAIEEEDGD